MEQPKTPEVKTWEEKDWIMDFDLLSLHLDMDGEQADEMRDFMRKIVASAKVEGRREVKEEYRNRALTELQEIIRTDTNLSKEGRLQMSAFIEGMKSRT